MLALSLPQPQHGEHIVEKLRIIITSSLTIWQPVKLQHFRYNDLKKGDIIIEINIFSVSHTLFPFSSFSQLSMRSVAYMAPD